jgi:hypothetical protein
MTVCKRTCLPWGNQYKWLHLFPRILFFLGFLHFSTDCSNLGIVWAQTHTYWAKLRCDVSGEQRPHISVPCEGFRVWPIDSSHTAGIRAGPESVSLLCSVIPWSHGKCSFGLASLKLVGYNQIYSEFWQLFIT